MLKLLLCLAALFAVVVFILVICVLAIAAGVPEPPDDKKPKDDL